MSNVYNLQFHLGETWTIDFETRKSDNTVLPLTGATAEWRLTTREGKTALTRAIGTGITITDEAQGQGTISVPKSVQQIAGVGPTVHRHELSVSVPSFGDSVQIVGFFNVEPKLPPPE